MKKCFRCNEEKELSRYSKNKVKEDGLCIVCKDCQKLSYDPEKQKKYKEKNETYYKEYREKNKEKKKQKAKEYREKNKEKLKEQDRVYYEQNKERIIEFSKQYYVKNKDRMKEYQREYRENNKEKLNELQREWRKNNPEKIKETKEQYKLNNPEKYKEQQRVNRKRRELNNPEKYKEKKKKQRQRRMERDNLFKTKSYVRTSICNSLTKNGYSKSSKAFEILGCSFEEFYAHIESQFLPNMNWENRSEWHLDHIVPISFGENEEEILLLNHYSNFRPLWSKDNLEKSDTLTEESIGHAIYKNILDNRKK